MKKILFSILFLFSIGLFAEDFTWAKYEILCYKNGTEPIYEEYIYLVENPTDFDDEESLKELMEAE